MTADPILIAADFIRQFEGDMRRHFADTRLTLPRYAVLVRADHSTVADLTPLVGVSQQMVWNTVRDLKRLGYLILVPSPDRRRRPLQLTAEGQAALTHASAVHLPPALVAAMQLYVTQQHP